MTPQEVADALRVSVYTIGRWHKAKWLTGVQVGPGKALRFRREDVENLLRGKEPA